MASQARRHHHEWRAKAESYKDDNIAITNVDAMVKADTPSGGRYSKMRTGGHGIGTATVPVVAHPIRPGSGPKPILV